MVNHVKQVQSCGKHQQKGSHVTTRVSTVTNSLSYLMVHENYK